MVVNIRPAMPVLSLLFLLPLCIRYICHNVAKNGNIVQLHVKYVEKNGYFYLSHVCNVHTKKRMYINEETSRFLNLHVVCP